MRPEHIDPEKWLEINTFLCALGRVSPEQCEANRRRPPYSSASECGPKVFMGKEKFMPFRCEKCTEWQSKIQEVYEKRRAYMSNKLIDECKNCRQVKPIKAKGLCSACYVKDLEQRKNKSEFQNKSSRRNSLDRKTVYVDFSSYPGLLDKLKEKAEREIRPLNLQIIWELKKNLDYRGAE